MRNLKTIALLTALTAGAGALLLTTGGHAAAQRGSIIGGAVGAGVGSALGQGRGRTAGAIGGALVGGMVGNNIEQNNRARSRPPVPQSQR